MDKNANAIDQLKKGIMSYVDTKLNKLAFVKTEIGVVAGVGTTIGNKINVKGAIYDDILSVGNIIFPNDCVVYLFIPNAQYSNMFILGQLDDTPANIKGGTIDIGDGDFTVDDSGSMVADKGSIGGWEINSNGLYSYYWDNSQHTSGRRIKLNPLFLGETGMSGAPMISLSNWNNTTQTWDLYWWVGEDGETFIFNPLNVSSLNVMKSTWTSYFQGICRFYNTVYNSSGGVVFTSDKNAKYEVESLDLENISNFIYSLNPVEYKFKEGTSNRKHHGLISQEVKEKMGENDWGLYIDECFNSDIELDEDGSIKKIKKDEETSYPKGLRYDELIADLIATCKYQKQQLDKQQEEIDTIKQTLKNLSIGNDIKKENKEE